jgi:anti-anti-sigma factor
VTSSVDIAVERLGFTVTARLNGDVDMTNAGYVGEELRGCMPNDAEALVVDLSEARYLDSAAVAVVFDLARRLASRRQALRLVVPPRSPLRRLLSITEVREVASLHESVDDAVTAG